MKNFKTPFLSALVFFGTLLVLSVGYAAWTMLEPTDADGGKVLSSTLLKSMINSINDIGIRTDGISSVGGNVGIGTVNPGAKLEVAGNIISSAQVFRAYMTASFSKGAGTWEKLPFNATLFNTLQGTFDATNNRFTASRPGYYQISVTGYSTTAGTGNERYAIGIKKNGVLEGFGGANYSVSDTPLSSTTMIIYMNGTTDYVEIHAYSAITATWQGGSTGGHIMLWHMNYLGS